VKGERERISVRERGREGGRERERERGRERERKRERERREMEQGCQIQKIKKAKFGHKQFQKRPNSQK